MSDKQVCDFQNKSCIPCEGGTKPMDETEIQKGLQQLKGWEYKKNIGIHKTFKFKGHYKTIAFVNAIAWISQTQGHHPVMEVGYNYCNVRYMTHAIQGMSENDFICAAKIDNLMNK